MSGDEVSFVRAGPNTTAAIPLYQPHMNTCHVFDCKTLIFGRWAEIGTPIIAAISVLAIDVQFETWPREFFPWLFWGREPVLNAYMSAAKG